LGCGFNRTHNKTNSNKKLIDTTKVIPLTDDSLKKLMKSMKEW